MVLPLLITVLFLRPFLSLLSKMLVKIVLLLVFPSSSYFADAPIDDAHCRLHLVLMGLLLFFVLLLLLVLGTPFQLRCVE